MEVLLGLIVDHLGSWWPEAVPEPRSAGLVYPVPSSRAQLREKAVIRVVGILNDSPSLVPSAPGVNII